jgi:hypothetical protein
VTFPTVFQFTGLGEDDDLAKGDSGALIATSDGVLVAMYFAGIDNFSFVVPVGDVFAAFDPPLTLITRP